jgi:hypothetical protein
LPEEKHATKGEELETYKSMQLIFRIYLPVFLLLSGTFIFVGCRSSSNPSIPDAPPPYPSFAGPQERYQSAQVYGGQPSASVYVPPYSELPNSISPANPYPYTPPSALPPRPSSSITPPPQYTSPNFYKQNNSTPRENKSGGSRFTLEAKADLWALVQDERGTELDWLKMKAGDKKPLHHQGPLTITCSSGDLLIIKDKEGKVIETNPNVNGISIVRLPAK